MSFNIALLRKAVDWAKEEDERKKKHAGGAYGLRDQGEHTWLQNAWATLTLGMGWKQHARKLPRHLNVVAVNPMSCGTTGCIAGQICIIAGDDLVIPKFSSAGDTLSIDYVADEEGNIHDIQTRAMDHLGVSNVGALFSGGNSIATVEEIARRIARDHGEVL